MKIAFVGNLLLDKTEWLVETGRKIIESGNELGIELNEQHSQLSTLDAQQKIKKSLENRLKNLASEIWFSMHIPWEPGKYYDLLTQNADISNTIKWIRFAEKINAATINLHMAGDDGVPPSEWEKIREKGKEYYLNTVGNNLQDVVAEAEKLGLNLTLEPLMTNIYDERTGKEKIFFVGNFPGDFEYIRKNFGYNFAITPDTCHFIMTWLGMQKSEYGIFPEDSEWKKCGTPPEFLSAWIKQAKLIYEIHVSDCKGLRFPSEHATELGDGLLGDDGLKTVIRAIPKNAINVLEIREDWENPSEIEKFGYLPKTIKSLQRFVEVAHALSGNIDKS